MTQVIELYPADVKQISSDDAQTRAEFEQLARKLGLHQLEKAGSPSKARRWCAENDLKALSEEELSCWREYLPTSYWSVRGKALVKEDVEILGFDEYCFHEGIPLVVLQRMEKIGHLFDVLEIRTPEVPQRIVSDPVLWGHVIAADGTRAIYPLARWAESDANFIANIADLKKILWARRGVMDDNLVKTADKLAVFVSTTCLVAVLFMIIAYGVSFIWSDMPYGRSAIIAGAFVGAGLSLSSICIQMWRVRSLKKSDPSLVRFV